MKVNNCPFCYPAHPVYLHGENWHIICTDEPNHYILAPKQHLPCTAQALSTFRHAFEAIKNITFPLEVVVHLNGYHISVNHLHVHLYRRE